MNKSANLPKISKAKFLQMCRNGDVAGLNAAKDIGFDMQQVFSDEEDISKTPILNALDTDVAIFIIENDGLVGYPEDVPLIHTILNLVQKNKFDVKVLRIALQYERYINNDWDGTNGDYLIHAAVRTGRKEILDIVLQAGADPSLLSNGGDSAIGIAASMGDAELVKMLIAAGSPLTADGFRFGIEFDDESDQPEVSEPVEEAKTKKIAALIKAAK